MLHNLTFEQTFRFFSGLVLSIIMACLYLILSLFHAGDDLDMLEHSRYHTIQISQDIRHNIVKQSTSARLYVVTGNPKYQDEYNNILSGSTLAKPQEIDKNLNNPYVKKKSFRDLQLERLKNRNLTNEEKLILDRVKIESQKILMLEKEAIFSVENIFKNEQRNFSLTNSSDQRYAVNILHSNEYRTAMQRIIGPLDEFHNSYRTRLHDEISLSAKNKTTMAESLPFLLVLCAISLLVVFGIVNRKLSHQYHTLEDISLRDELTGIRNRRYGLDFGEQILAISQRNHQQLAVLLMDIDHFKAINDQYGHDIGDETLKTVCKNIANRTRSSDIFSRYGGEEFMIILGDINSQNAVNVANAIRKIIAALPITAGNETINCTVSIGIAMSHSKSDLKSLIANADQAMYHAKNTGRNKVVLHKNKNQLDSKARLTAEVGKKVSV